MRCSCSCSEKDCTTVVTVRVMPVLLGLALAFGLFKLVAGARFGVSVPTGGWILLLIIAAGGSFWGLWLGHSVHGRGETLAVGMFGLLLLGTGLLVYAPLVLIGVCVLLAAAIWSAQSQPKDASEG